MNKKDRSEKLLDSIYNNKAFLLRYFAVSAVAALLRYAAEVFTAPIFGESAPVFCFGLWSVIFYYAVKYIAFRHRSPDIYRLMIQIMLYIFCVFALWCTRQLLVGIVYMITSNIALGMSIGGAVNELVCLALMWRIVFYKK